MTIQSEIKAFLATALSDASAIEADFQSLLSSPQVAAYAPMAEAALTGFLASKGIPAAAVEQWGGAILAVLNGAAKIAAASAPVAPISTTTTVTQ